MFLQAKPIYPKQKSKDLNTYAVFQAELPLLQHATLHVTAASFYQVWVNGRFVAFGPARTAGGYARVDELDLTDYDSATGKNELVITVVGYACRSLSTVYQPSFLCAEVLQNGQVTAYTGRDFTAYLPTCKLQKVMRYSGQRHFSEVWDLSGANALPCDTCRAEIEVLPLELTYLPRVAPYPHYEDIFLSQAVSRGVLSTDPEAKVPEKLYSFQPSPRWGCFDPKEIPYHPYEWIYQQKQTKLAGAASLPFTLQENEYAILDLSRIETGFLFFSAIAESACDLVIGFSEDSSPDHFTFTNLSSYNALEYLLPAGKESFGMSFEPYVCRWVLVTARKGSLTLNSLGIKTFQNDIRSIEIPKLPSQKLERIYRAAARTYAHNAVDVYTDCPSRERAGWLCDSYFTAKTEYALFGSTAVEDAFLENYRLFQNNGDWPEGMIPMCYPSDMQDTPKYIPQWSMWYIIELEEYLNQRNTKMDRELFRAGVEGLLAFYQQYENADGLLEKLPSWNFVEWSVANQWTQDVNYPTNFLYAGVLTAAYRLYGNEEHLRRAKEVQAATIAQSFNGTVFLDHAVRDEQGQLNRLEDCSEAGQYYAILFGGFDWNAPKYAKLKELVLQVFTPTRTDHPEIHPVNAFIGVYLRLETLIRMEQWELLLHDIEDFFGEMEQTTGTLWEYRQPIKSRDHGFASYALVAIRRALNL